MKKVLLGMSGGVDSTITAHLLQEQGYEVTGAYMQLWRDTDDPIRDQNDLEKVKHAAKFLNVSLQILDLREVFFEEIVKDFIDQYQKGLTPNPCVICNQKFKYSLMEEAAEGDFDYLATGHYAKIIKNNDEYQLWQADDKKKDQSYVLYHLPQEQLSRILLPLGTYKKSEIRAIASQIGFDNKSLSDSQDICFISQDKTYRDLLERFNAIGEPGEFIDPDGNILGQHSGIGNYTIGQRKNLGMAFGKKVFVSEIDPLTNRITVGDAQNLLRDKYHVNQVNWNSKVRPELPLKAEIANRYQAKTASSEIYHKPDLSENSVEIRCKEPQRAITPGQAAVFYQGERCIGGGLISI